MSEFAYHQEALRKARIQQRAHQAKLNLAANDTAEKSKQKPYGTRSVSSNYNEANRMNSSYERQRSASELGHSSGEEPVAPPASYYIQKDLRHQEKVLRNHNLVMGPMSAFEDLYNCPK